MDFNQTARVTLTQVQSELAQGKAEISWAVYEPIVDLDDYRKWIKKQFGWQAYFMAVVKAFLLAFIFKALLQGFIFVAFGMNILGNIGGGIGLAAAVAVGMWLMWQNGKDRARAKKALSRGYLEYRICANFKKRYFLAISEGKVNKRVKFHDKRDWTLPAFNLPKDATPNESAQRDALHNALVQQMGVHFAEHKVW